MISDQILPANHKLQSADNIMGDKKFLSDISLPRQVAYICSDFDILYPTYD